MIRNSRLAEPRACVTAWVASQSNSPSFLATSDSSIMPIRKRKRSVPLPRAATACCQDSKLNSTSIAAPAIAQTNSGQFHGRAITPSVATAAITQMAELNSNSFPPRARPQEFSRRAQQASLLDQDPDVDNCAD